MYITNRKKVTLNLKEEKKMISYEAKLPVSEVNDFINRLYSQNTEVGRGTTTKISKTNKDNQRAITISISEPFEKLLTASLKDGTLQYWGKRFSRVINFDTTGKTPTVEGLSSEESLLFFGEINEYDGFVAIFGPTKNLPKTPQNESFEIFDFMVAVGEGNNVRVYPVSHGHKHDNRAWVETQRDRANVVFQPKNSGRRSNIWGHKTIEKVFVSVFE